MCSYFLKGIQWARKYGIRINLDLHAVVGSQNGWNHSGRFGQINFLRGPMGVANAQRTLDHIRILAEFISQPQYKDVVTMFGILNEPQGTEIGQDILSALLVFSLSDIWYLSVNYLSTATWRLTTLSAPPAVATAKTTVFGSDSMTVSSLASHG